MKNWNGKYENGVFVLSLEEGDKCIAVIKTSNKSNSNFFLYECAFLSDDEYFDSEYENICDAIERAESWS